MAAKLAPVGNGMQFFTAQGVVLAGGKINTYLAGTTTRADTFPDSTQNQANKNANPIILGSNGMSATEIWLPQGVAYKFIITDANDVVIPGGTLDNLSGINDPTGNSASQWQMSNLTGTYISATSFSLAGDQTTDFHFGRKLQFTVTAGTVYGEILSSSYSVGTLTTTITMTMDSGNSLDAGLSAVNLSLLRADHSALPRAPYYLLGSTLGMFTGMINGTVVPSRTGNAETIAIKTLAGNDPSPADPVYMTFRSATAGSGAYINRTIIAALSLTIPSTATLGMSNAVASRLWLGAFDDSGAIRLAIINPRTSTSVFPLRDDQLYSATATPASASATIYSNATVTSKAFRVLGYLEYTLATAGTWVTAPSKIQMFYAGVPMPGELIQTTYSEDSAVATGTTTTPIDDTAPQNTEGTQFMSLPITPTSAINILEIEHTGTYSYQNGNQATVALHQDAIASAIAAVLTNNGNVGTWGFYGLLRHKMTAGTTVATTFKINVGAAAAGTITFNGQSSARLYGGVSASILSVREFMV